MAGKARNAPSAVKTDLLAKGQGFSFFQALRLLRLDSREEEAPDHPGNVRVRPELSLAFPPADIAKIEEVLSEHPTYLVTATLFGLYGVSSPLPVFYTEELIEEKNDNASVSRDFVDIIHQRLYMLLFRSWAKYRQCYQVVEQKDSRDRERLYCLLGLGEKELRKDDCEAYSLIRYAGLFTQFPRSALGLETLLRDALGSAPVMVTPCVSRSMEIPEDQRNSLGASSCTIGESLFLGSEIDDRTGAFRVSIGPLLLDQFQYLLPGSAGHKKLDRLTRLYVTDSLEYDVELIAQEGEIEPSRLGSLNWSRLGLDTWIYSDGYVPGEVSIVFAPQEHAFPCASAPLRETALK